MNILRVVLGLFFLGLAILQIVLAGSLLFGYEVSYSTVAFSALFASSYAFMDYAGECFRKYHG